MKSPPLFWRLKWFLVLLLFMVLDLGPVPFTASLVMYIFWFRPLWFKKFMDRLYTGK